MALLEVCCGNPESVDAAVLGGARRIELCADLEADGLTPPTAWIRDAKARYPSLTVHVLIRPRAGDFVYSPAEADAMSIQVEEALEAGADGIVLGALTPEGDVDVPLLERLVSLVESYNLAAELVQSDLCHAANDSHFFPGPSRRVSITFHRAFDRCRRPYEALEQIIALGCDRILTSGQAATAEAGAATLRELQRRAGGRIGILPGSGVTPGNAARILATTGCTEIHASASVTRGGKKVTDAELVAGILAAING
jgi:copper homeostasis protein